MNILTLDLGTKTGWAFGNSKQGLIDSGVKNFNTARIEGAGMRYHRFRKWLQEITGNLKPDLVYFEEVRRHSGIKAAHVYGAMEGHLTAFCEEHKIAFTSVPVGTIKKHATGKGNAGKNQVIAAMFGRFGELAKDDNHADAMAILSYALEDQGESILVLKPKNKIVKK